MKRRFVDFLAFIAIDQWVILTKVDKGQGFSIIILQYVTAEVSFAVKFHQVSEIIA